MSKSVRHTALIKVIRSNASLGVAEVLHGHWQLTECFAFPEIESARLANREKGETLLVTIKTTHKRRMVMTVVNATDDDKTVTYLKRTLENENKVFERTFPDLVLRRDSAPAPPSHLSSKCDVVEKAHEEEFKKTIEKERKEKEAEITAYWKDRVYIREEDNRLFETLRSLTQKRHVAMMMIGPSGYGKTSVPEQKAKDWDVDFLRWDCATVRDPEEFFGFRGAFEGSTVNEDGENLFIESQFTKTVKAGNCVIVLDELNRIDPYISNILFPLLDHAGKTQVAGHEIEVGPNILFVATVNLGYQFTGTFTLDTALTNRFTAKVLVDSLPEEIEKNILVARGGVSLEVAEKIVEVVTKLRALNNNEKLSVDASTRVSIQIAELVGCGMKIREAVVYTIVNGVSKEEAKSIVDVLGSLSL